MAPKKTAPKKQQTRTAEPKDTPKPTKTKLIKFIHESLKINLEKTKITLGMKMSHLQKITEMYDILVRR